MTQLPPQPNLPPPPAEPNRRSGSRRLSWAIGAVAVVVAAALVVESLRFAHTPSGDLASQSRVCQNTDTLLATAESAPNDAWEVPSGLAEQLPKEIGPGLILPVDRPSHQASVLAEGRADAGSWIDALVTNGYEDGLERFWVGAYAVAAAEVLRFGSHAGALGFQHWIIHASCFNASRVFSVDDLPGSIGLQLIWGVGDVSEQVSFVRGPYRYLVSIRSGQTPLRWWILDETARLGSALGIPMVIHPTPCTGVGDQLRSENPQAQARPLSDASTPVALLPSDLGSPVDTGAIGTSLTTKHRDPVYTGTDEAFADAWRQQLSARGFRSSAKRDWTVRDGDASIVVEAFATHQDARAYQRWIMENVICLPATETFAPAVMGAIGLRVPVQGGRTADVVSFVRGRFRVEALSFSKTVSTDHLRVDAVAQVAQQAFG